MVAGSSPAVRQRLRPRICRRTGFVELRHDLLDDSFVKRRTRRGRRIVGVGLSQHPPSDPPAARLTLDGGRGVASVSPDAVRARPQRVGVPRSRRRRLWPEITSKVTALVVLRRWSPLVAGTSAALFTGLVVFIRPFDVAYQSWTLHVAIESVAAVVCTVAAYLFLGRYQLSRSLTDLLLVLSLLTLAVGGLCFSLLPAALAGGHITRFSTWAPVVSDVLGAVGLAAAAFTRRQLRLQLGGALLVGGAFVGVILLIAFGVGLTTSRLPNAISPQLSPVQGERELLVGRPAILALQLVSVLLLAASSIGFWRRRATGEELAGTLSTATALGAPALRATSRPGSAQATRRRHRRSHIVPGEGAARPSGSSARARTPVRDGRPIRRSTDTCRRRDRNPPGARHNPDLRL